MLEGIFTLREKAGLVQELGRLEVRQAPVEGLLRQLGNGLHQGQGNLQADDGRRLQQPLLFRRQTVDPCRQDCLHRRRHLNAWHGLGQVIGARRADQYPGLHQGAHALLQEERIALRACNEQRRERHQTGVVP
jgi:hypothetical protein